jgi:hypothetical protein
VQSNRVLKEPAQGGARAAEIRLNVGDLIVSILGENGLQVTGYAEPFIEAGPPEATICLTSKGEEQDFESHGQILDGQQFGWSAYRHHLEGAITVDRHGRQILTRLGPDDRDDDIWISSPQQTLTAVELLPIPITSILSRHRGLLLHSCGLVFQGQGVIFAGVSGTGKSTMAGLWQRWGDARAAVVDDEHLIVRYRRDLPRLYGVPWRRGDRQSLVGDVPLRAIFFLVQGPQNLCRPLSPADALGRLMSQVFLPLWSKAQMDRVLETGARLIQDTHCFELEFLPRPETIEFLQGWLEENL